MIITLKDGSKREVQEGISVIDLAKEISEGLARVATAGRVDGKVVDLRYNLNKDCNVEILTFDDEDGKKAYWHTTSHIMAQAIKRLYKDVKLAIGPAIDGGFYYDFDTEYRFSEADFEKVEAEMKKIIKEDLPIERFELPRSEAIKLMKDAGEDYKVELIEDLPEDEVLSFYKQGEFTDLCAGPHLMSTGKVKCAKLLSTSGAYWRGDEKNKMLQRIYAISFPKASLLEEHLAKLEEAKQRIANGEKYVVRQTIPSTGITSFEDEVYGHIEVENAGLAEGVLLKSDGYPTYNFANIVDDHLMNITHVVRGNEYLSSTPKYNLIYQAFGWDVPSYIHCPPVMKDEKHKLSKRNGDASYQDLINKGFLNEAILNYIALLGLSPEGEQEIFSLDELIEAFDVKRISKSGAIFDMNKLKWINSQYIKKLDTKQLTELCLPFLQEAYDLSDKSEALIEKLVEVHRDHISCGEEIVEQVKLFFEDEIHLEEEAIEFMKDEAIPNTLAVFKSKVAELAEEDFKQDQIFACIKATQKEAKARGKMLYMPLRIATTGIMHGPDLAASMELLGKEKVLKRLG